jgi:hypothetical protein
LPNVFSWSSIALIGTFWGAYFLKLPDSHVSTLQKLVQMGMRRSRWLPRKTRGHHDLIKLWETANICQIWWLHALLSHTDLTIFILSPLWILRELVKPMIIWLKRER